jgi:hypothetical protein
MEEKEGAAKAAFEAGIKLGALFHQFIGSPVSEKNVEVLERAIESCVKLQPFVEGVKVRIDREKLKERISELEYTSLSPEMLYARVEVRFGDVKAIGVLEWDEKLRYPMMKLIL